MTGIKKARLNAGISQKEVALTLKVKAPSVWAWENGKSKPTASNLEQLAKLYNVSVDFLLDRETEQEETKPEEINQDGDIQVMLSQFQRLDHSDRQRVLDFVQGILSVREQ